MSFIEGSRTNTFDVSVIILVVNNKNNKNNNIVEDFNSIKICGKTMLDWVKFSVRGYDCKLVDFDEKDDLVKVLQDNISDSRYTIVLYSDTPLVTAGTLNETMDRVRYKYLSYVKLPRGYVFDTSHLRKIDKVYLDNKVEFSEEFTQCVDLISYKFVQKVMQDRILKYLLFNGVIINSPENVCIEADVTIGKNTIIEPMVTITGNTVIGANCLIGTNSEINSSAILDNCTIKGSIVKNSIIENGVKISPFCEIGDNAILRQNVKVNSFSKIQNREVKADTEIKSYSNLGD